MTGKMTSVKEKIDTFKKGKSREILVRLIDCKATTVRKDGNQKYLQFKTRGCRWYKSLTSCARNLDSTISLAYFISSVLLIPFICCILSLLQNPSLQDTK